MNQNKNKILSDILAYKPKYKSILKTADVKSEVVPNGYNFSPAVSNLTETKTTEIFKSMDTNISMIDNIISEIKESIESDIPKFDVNDIESYISENDSITGDGRFEMYSVLNTLVNATQSIRNKYWSYYYGNRSIAEAEQFEFELHQKIKQLEKDGDVEKINYTAMAIDSYITSIINNFSDASLHLSISVNTSYALGGFVDANGVKGIDGIVERKFEKTSYDRSLNRYMIKNNIENIERSIDKVLNLKNDYLNILNTISSLNGETSLEIYQFLKSEKEETYGNLFSSVSESIAITSALCEELKLYSQNILDTYKLRSLREQM